MHLRVRFDCSQVDEGLCWTVSIYSHRSNRQSSPGARWANRGKPQLVYRSLGRFPADMTSVGSRVAGAEDVVGPIAERFGEESEDDEHQGGGGGMSSAGRVRAGRGAVSARAGSGNAKGDVGFCNWKTIRAMAEPCAFLSLRAGCSSA